jgi:cation:H+ antiporter
VSSLAAAGLLVAGIALVVAGADVFFAGLLGAAARLGASAFVLSVVVSGFEVENLVAGIAANARGLPDAAAGTFLGGTTFLALGVAGVGALVGPLRAELGWPVFAWTVVAPLPLVALAADGELTRPDAAGLLAWFVVAIVGLALAGRSALGGEPPARRRYAIVRVVAGLGLLSAGGEVLGEGMRRTIARFGVSEALLGNTVVAASVEGEEVARVVVPARRGRPDVALGNIFGTVVHFLALNAGVIALVRPLDLDRATVTVHLPAAAGGTVLVAGLTALRRGLGRAEGAVLILLYGGYVAAAVAMAL